MERHQVAVIVAHPDDETLWAGGTILSHPDWKCTIVSLCRASDPDRAPRFLRVLDRIGAAGAMGDLDDGPEQIPLTEDLVRQAVLQLLPDTHYDIVLTHGPLGEYTRHRRHEEVSRAVADLWRLGEIRSDSLWLFAYDDAGGASLPAASPRAPIRQRLDDRDWLEKYRIITEVYGFRPESFEARATPRDEAFWSFDTPQAYTQWLEEEQQAIR
jgi:LmbE family N-acetylglucosaminyl deacetylase